MTRALRLATRASPLAKHQAQRVADMWHAIDASLDVQFVFIETTGDAMADIAVHALPERGAFTNALDRAVAAHRADVAVHSAKDLPAHDLVEELVLGAVPERVDVRDALVGARLDDLAPGALVATGAVRRRAQLAWLRPDLSFMELRGNIGTRLSKVPEGGAVVVALAALQRLDRVEVVAEVLSLQAMLSQVGQGALALKCRVDDAQALSWCASIDDVAAHRAVRTERAFLHALGGGCDAPVAAHATCEATGEIALEAMVASADGHAVLRRRDLGDDPEQLGTASAKRLVDNGGSALLELAAP